MSFFQHGIKSSSVSVSSAGTSGFLSQVRHATKRAAGSRTNKNDSAGRRLGPKAYEGHFVKPGQIIMRQRGTTLHPGENTDIGRDHTIFALEPGWVRFYYDPFHPLRKYVGVALTKDTRLPLPHFEPRMRRFGYEEILDADKAIQEEEHMSRKEWMQQSELQAAKAELEAHLSQKREEFGASISGKFDADLELATDRMMSIYQLVNNGQSIEEAQIQTTYNYVYDLKLAVQRGEVEEAASKSLKETYVELSRKIDETFSIDAQGSICGYISPEDKLKAQEATLSQLKSEYSGKILKLEDKRAILDLIQTPGVFGKEEQNKLKKQFLPSVLPLSVQGTVKENLDPKNPGKGITVVRVFDEKTKNVKVIGRTKDAFVPQ
ncbi:54S ribosomal protein L2, mitochondrial [[Candida] anglica]|uniref:Large ribosomal subunit protein bL27m n=1 Tax=[Candida] anglica TaxID=148631 RepID=A0ABP0EHN2_9ASCO